MSDIPCSLLATVSATLATAGGIIEGRQYEQGWAASLAKVGINQCSLVLMVPNHLLTNIFVIYRVSLDGRQKLDMKELLENSALFRNKTC